MQNSKTTKNLQNGKFVPLLILFLDAVFCSGESIKDISDPKCGSEDRNSSEVNVLTT